MPVQNGHCVIQRIIVEYIDPLGNTVTKDIPNPGRWIAIAWNRTDFATGNCNHFFSEFHHHGNDDKKHKDVETKWNAKDPASGALPLLMLKDPECNSDPLYP